MTFIVAEVGSNFTSFEEAKDSITMAKNCGADAVKFQMYTNEEMYGFTVTKNSSIDWDWVPKLKVKADSVGIEFLCTAFSPEGLKYLDPFVKRHKIASSDLSYPDLLIAAKNTAKPVFLSTGGSSFSDISMAKNYLDPNQTVLLYCISHYPSSNVNLFCLDKLKELGLPVGYSCHTSDWYTPVSAVKHHGAAVIEKHFKLREMDTPDAPHSLLPDDFKKMVDAIRGEVTCHFPDPQEKEFVLKHKRRLIATKDIQEGEILIYNENFGCYRSLKDDPYGITGFAYIHVHGKIARVAIKQGDSITPASF